jgi:hypothetical protein
LALNVVAFAQQSRDAEQSSADAEKFAIIQLIEDRLAKAYTIRSENETPDFGTLDRIFPNWHRGEPAKERKNWTFHDYRYHTVSYVVHSVWMNQAGMATVKGKKQVNSSRKVRFLKLFRRVKEESSETLFTIKCRRNPSGSWEIMEETGQ